MATNKPSTSEDEFFAREDAERKRKLSLEQTKALAASERDRLQKLHHMHCPECGLKLQQLALHGVMVSKCFNCHGVFLNGADLEKMVGEEGYWSRLLHFFARKDYDSHGND